MKIPCAVSGRRYAFEPSLGERADRGLEHQVELARLGEIAVRRLAGLLARLAAAMRVLEPVGAKAELAGAAVDQRVGEPLDVTGGLPDERVQDHRGVERHDVVALLHHRVEPARADVVLGQDAIVAVVVGRAEAAIDLGRGEDEAAPPGEGDDLVHRDGVARHGRPTLSSRSRENARVSSGPPVELHVISDSTGETAARLVHALEAQFPDQEFEEIRHPAWRPLTTSTSPSTVPRAGRR